MCVASSSVCVWLCVARLFREAVARARGEFPAFHFVRESKTRERETLRPDERGMYLLDTKMLAPLLGWHLMLLFCRFWGIAREFGR